MPLATKFDVIGALIAAHPGGQALIQTVESRVKMLHTVID
jgi:hypothetical protein